MKQDKNQQRLALPCRKVVHAKSGEDLPWPFPGYDVSPALRAASPGRPTSELEHLLRGI